MRKWFLYVMSFLVLAACSKDSSNSNSPVTPTASTSPSKSYQLAQKPELTEAQKQEMKSFSSAFRKMPDAKLLLPEENEGLRDNTPSQMENPEFTSELQAETRQIYEEILAKCQKNRSAPVITGKTSRPGDQLVINGSAQISGADCPLKLNQTSKTESTVISSNREDVDLEFQKTKDPKVYEKLQDVSDLLSSRAETTDVTDSNLQSKVGFKTRTIHWSFSGRKSTTLQDGRRTDRSRSIKGLAVQDFTTLSDTRVILSIYVDIAKSPAGMDAYGEVTFNFPSASPTAQVFQKAGEEPKYYLNGAPSTKDELEELFGMPIPDGN